MATNKNNIAIIIGAGAVENAWTPILNVFKLMHRDANADAVNCLFAKYIYRLRLYSKFSDSTSVDNLKTELENMKIMKSVICDQIKEYQKKGILCARKEFAEIFRKFVLNSQNNMFGLVTTNWDTSIDLKADEIVKQAYYDVESAKCFHLHGSIDYPDQLYLPSEMSHENYRTDDENKKLGFDVFNTLKFLGQANQIILYGLSLDPLDAELIQILSSTFYTSDILREVIIINPDYNRVKNRVQLQFYPRKDISIKCFEPKKLDQEK
jgi:hypothetical protein